MKCITCEALSWHIICTQCQSNLLSPGLYKRQVEKDFFVYSFYNYEEIEHLLSSKYHFYGDKIYHILGKNAFSYFAKYFYYTTQVYSIGIDDHTDHEFSHTAILNKYLRSAHITPLYNQLKATKKVKYAGKDLEFRQKHPRKFKLADLSNQSLILVDDLITTGTTILEAKKVCQKSQNRVLFALTLADAKL